MILNQTIGDYLTNYFMKIVLYFFFVFFTIGISYSQSELKNHKEILLPYVYGDQIKSPYDEKWYSTVFIGYRSKNYIITDSLDITLKSTSRFKFYFMTPEEIEFNVDCPNEFGFIVLDENSKEIYNNFDLGYNFFEDFHQFKLESKERNLLVLGSSGCGSGWSLMYFDIIFENSNFILKSAFSGVNGGYSSTLFMPEKNMYIQLDRINPSCHYSCPSLYKLTYFNLTNDSMITQKKTKFTYDDVNDTGNEELINRIRSKEPEIIIFK